MKKIIIAVVAIAVSVFANAATVNWSANAVQSSPDVAIGAGWYVQVFDSSVAYDYDKALAGEITAWSTGATVAAGSTFRATGSTTLDNGTSKTIYMVIYDGSTIGDAKNYIVSDNLSIAAAAGGAAVNASFGAMTGTTTGNKFLNSQWTATAIPEPTSGLLLLLGMAGLALKRKHA